jgi:hypothetical protein
MINEISPFIHSRIDWTNDEGSARVQAPLILNLEPMGTAPEGGLHLKIGVKLTDSVRVWQWSGIVADASAALDKVAEFHPEIRLWKADKADKWSAWVKIAERHWRNEQ